MLSPESSTLLVTSICHSHNLPIGRSDVLASTATIRIYPQIDLAEEPIRSFVHNANRRSQGADKSIDFTL